MSGIPNLHSNFFKAYTAWEEVAAKRAPSNMSDEQKKAWEDYRKLWSDTPQNIP